MPQNNLKVLLDALTETGVYVIREDDHTLLYFNRKVKETSPYVRLGVPCHEIWKGTCGDCPLLTIGNALSNHTIHYNDPFGEVVDITANRILWDGSIPAFVILVAPHMLDHEGEESFRQIKKLYNQSLTTVFDECLIVNLTQDYYLTFQKDTLWDDIPPQGRFGDANIHYAHKTVYPEDLETFLSLFSRDAMLRVFSSGKKQIIKRLRRKTRDGVYHMVEFSAARLEDFGCDCWCALVFRDVNEEYLQECRRDLDMMQLTAAAKAAYQVLISVNLTQNTYRMLEYGFFQLKNLPQTGNFQDLLNFSASTADPAYRAAFFEKFSRDSLLKSMAAGIRQISLELPQLADDGKYHWNLSTVVRVDDPYTKDVLEVTMIKNIDEEHRRQEEALEKERKAKLLLEDALQKAEGANHAKSQFLSRMSHDIRTPMNAILGLTALARLHPDDPDKITEYLRGIETSGTHLLNLINEVLDVSKIESGKTRLLEFDFDLRELVAGVISLVEAAARQKKLALSCHMPTGLYANVSGDEQKLRQILLNILENAVKYTPEGGHIELSVSEEPGASSAAALYRFVISDNGIGMKPEFIAHIFEPFSRADERRVSNIPGTGLGMTIVENLVTMLGGQISVESTYQKGSCFTILLPLIKKEKRAENGTPKLQALSAEETFAGLRVLLAEDNEINRQIAQEMLWEMGVTADAAENGLEAVQAVKEHPAGYYDLVLMDIRMPVMNGYEAVERLRGMKKGAQAVLPVIAMTADAFSDDVKKARLAGMNGHLSKPISFEKLGQTLLFCKTYHAGAAEKDGLFRDFSRP